MAVNGSAMIQIIDHAGDFHDDIQSLVAKEGIQNAGAYSLIAIMGPQSSGKSTLLNHAVSSSKYRFGQKMAAAPDRPSPPSIRYIFSPSLYSV